MIIIKCVKCKEKIFKYNKIGQGRILKVYYSRVEKDYSLKEDGEIKCCNCKNIIGYKMGNYIKMKLNSFIYTGHKIKL
ncbi:MAG: hypothetical protein ABF289_18550 [Clostridiales bacterium]